MAHLLSCRLLDEDCTADDLATVTDRAMACARKWGKRLTVSRLRKTWQNTLYADVRLLKVDPWDVHDRKKWRAIGQHKASRAAPDLVKSALKWRRRRTNLANGLIIMREQTDFTP